MNNKSAGNDEEKAVHRHDQVYRWRLHDRMLKIIKERSGNISTIDVEGSDTIRIRQTRIFATLEEAKKNSIRLAKPEDEKDKRAAGQRRTSRFPQDFGLKIWKSGKIGEF